MTTIPVQLLLLLLTTLQLSRNQEKANTHTHTHTKDLKREIFLFLIHSACFFLSGFCGVRANMSAVKHFLSLSKDSTRVVSSVVVSDITFASWRNARAERKKKVAATSKISPVCKNRSCFYFTDRSYFFILLCDEALKVTFELHEWSRFGGQLTFSL